MLKGRRHNRLAAGACVLACLTAGSLGAVTASAAAPAPEAGVVLPYPNHAQVADVTALGTPWVRVFATWPDLEPQRGAYSTFWLSYYDQLFKELPAKTRVIVDVVDSPSWETGSSD